MSSLILPESHVLPPQSAPLVPLPLHPLLQIRENQLTADPLKPSRVVRPSEQKGEAEQEVPWPGFGLIYRPDPGKPQQSSLCQTGTTWTMGHPNPASSSGKNLPKPSLHQHSNSHPTNLPIVCMITEFVPDMKQSLGSLSLPQMCVNVP